MKRLLFILLVALMSVTASAQIAEAWISLPDSLCPYLSQQQRYYLLQYANSGQKDSIKNAFDGYTMIDSLSIANGYLSLRMTSNLQWELSVIPESSIASLIPSKGKQKASPGNDTNTMCLCLKSTVCAPLCTSVYRYYDFAWNLLAVRHDTFDATPTDEEKEQHF